MRTMTLAMTVLAVSACAFPGYDPGPTPDTTLGGGVSDTGDVTAGTSGDPSTVPPGAFGTFELAAYQATGTIDGAPATISRGAIHFGPGAGEVVNSGDCYGVRLAQGQKLETALNAGTIHIDGAKQPYSCTWANGGYACDLPTDDTFFTPGSELGVTIEGSNVMRPESFTGVVPPRAPVPEVALDRLFDETRPVTITWRPDASDSPAQMTCLNLESLDDEGETTGFVQCDVDDASGQTTVPVEMVKMLDPSSPRLRATLYSANAGGTVDAYVTFGSGRFVELHR